MIDIKVDICYKNKDSLIDSFNIKTNQKIKTIDDVRFLIIRQLNDFYLDMAYKINIFKSNDGYIKIYLIFEDDIRLKRESTLNCILREN